MNYIKFQRECVNTLLSGGRVVYDIMPDGQYLVTTNGYYAVVLSPKQIVFSLDRCIKANLCTNLESHEKDQVIRPTDIFFRKDGRTGNKWKSESFNIWFDSKFLSAFDGYSNLFAYSPLSRTLVKSQTGDIIGLILPVRRKGDSEDAE